MTGNENEKPAAPSEGITARVDYDTAQIAHVVMDGNTPRLQMKAVAAIELASRVAIVENVVRSNPHLNRDEVESRVWATIDLEREQLRADYSIVMKKESRGFTLVELLVVVVVVLASLLGIVLPSLAYVRASAVDAGCRSNLRSISQVVAEYRGSHRGRVPNMPGDLEDVDLSIFHCRGSDRWHRERNVEPPLVAYRVPVIQYGKSWESLGAEWDTRNAAEQDVASDYALGFHRTHFNVGFVDGHVEAVRP